MNLTLAVVNEILLIAFGVAAGYLAGVAVLSRVTQFLARSRQRRHALARPGEAVHQALKVTGRLRDHYRTAALLFGVSFLLLFYFGELGHWLPVSLLLNVPLTLLLLAPVGYGMLKVWQLARYRIRLANLLDLHNQVARRMMEVLVRGNRVYSSVRVHDSVIDNVVIGRGGIYALQLFMPPAGAESVRYERGALIFQPCGTRLSLNGYNKAIRALEGLLTERTGNAFTVLPVVVIPDCRIEAAESQGPMLVSMQACAAFVSWRDDKFFMHDEDIAATAGWLGKQTLVAVPPNLKAAISSLHGRIDWPALI